MGAGLEYAVSCLGVWNGDLYAGGWFTSSGTTSLSGIARWDGSARQDVGGGINGALYALLATPAGLVVAGDFDDSYAVPGARNVVRWNGTAWSALGNGLEGVVHGLALHAGEVAAVGDFTSHVALFDGSTWVAVGGGLPDGSTGSFVNAVISHGGQLYIGGAFDPVVEGTQLNNIAGWEGLQWKALQSGLDGSVQTLGEWDGKLVIGGSFLNPIFHLGTWDGFNFAYLGGIGGVGWNGGDYVNTIATSTTRLYASGVLTLVAPSTYGANVFAWDGSAYASLGDGNGLNAELQSIGKSTPGFNNIARWDGSVWHPLAGGVNGPVRAIFVDGSDVWAGGMFSAAGGKVSLRIAKWSEPVTAVAPAPLVPIAIEMGAPSPNPSSGPTKIAFSLPERAEVRVSITDTRGRLVASLSPGDLAAGEHAIFWNGRARNGERAASGVYWAVMAAGGRRGSTRIVIVE